MSVRNGIRLDHRSVRSIAGLIVLLTVAACSGSGGGGGDSQSDTPPPPAPTVSATFPANAATGVATNSSVSATFSEPMTDATLTTASFTLATTIGGAAVTGTVNVSGNTATFTPSAPLAGSTQYTATITIAAKDAAGNALAANFSWQFTTGAAPDTTPPTVSLTSPAINATNVALNASVSATFSEAMNTASLTTTSFKLATTIGGAVVTGTVNVNGTTATFTPNASLASSTEYTATITIAAKDAAGNALAANFTWQFTTGAAPDTTPPMVFSTTPPDAATGVATTSSVSATFTEVMNNSTLTTTSFKLARTTGGAAVGGAVNVSGNTATFTPSAPLARSTQYTATITSAAKDVVGNPLANFSWNFTTSATYTTSFALTENPISEDGRWINGGTDGLSWTDVSSDGGIATGHQTGATYTDSSAILTGDWGPDQDVTGVVHTDNQVDGCFQEVELRLRNTLSSRSMTGYEVGFKMSQTSGAYVIIVRWNGILGDFTYLLNEAGSQYAVANGDTLRATIVGDVITAYINKNNNSTLVAQVNIRSMGGTVYTTGNPGMGFNLESANLGGACAGTNGDYGLTSFTATDTP